MSKNIYFIIQFIEAVLYLIGLNQAEYITLIKVFKESDQVEIINYSKKCQYLLFTMWLLYFLLLNGHFKLLLFSSF